MRMWVRVVRGLGIAAALYGGVVLSVGIGSVALVDSALAQTAANVVVQGNRRVDTETIRSYFRTGPGERLDAVKLDEAYKALLATGLFEDVQINPQGGRIVVTVYEASVINRIQFEGNRAQKDELLAAEIQSKPRAGFSRQTVRSDVQRIIDIYRATGRYDVRVDPKIIELPNNRVDLVFEITEGRKTAVRQINFNGNRAFSASRLKDAIKSAETGILSFFKSTDVYDADRVEADKDLLRRFYLRQGYADVRVVAAVSEFDPVTRGFIVTFVIDEGEPYRFGSVDIQSNVRDVDPAMLRGLIKARSGSLYDAEAIEKTVEQMSVELAKRGYAFAQVRPRGDRIAETRTINVAFVIDQGARAYIERINVRGNTRTRDHVIRREFDIAEGDAYNHALVDRAERRLKNLAYFKTVKITSEAGSAPDRVIINVDVEEQATGEFSVAGGYSTADGFMAEVSVGERNLLGYGQYAKAAVQYGQKARGFEVSFVEPYLMGYRLAFGVDVFAKQTLASTYQSYESRVVGGGFRFGIPLNDELSVQTRYSIYEQQIYLADINNCYNPSTDPLNPARNGVGCFPAAAPLRQAANFGPVVTSLVGYTLAYNTLDNVRSPTKGLQLEFKQDFAGVGGDVQFVRSIGDFRAYYDVWGDFVAMGRLQGGHITSWGGQQLRMLDHFFMGPNLVRGFSIAGIGPRDVTPNSTQDALGGTMYWGASLEVQHPLFFAPKDFGIKLAAFADAGSLWGYRGLRTYPNPGDVVPPNTFPQTIDPHDANVIRSSVGLGLVWDSPFGPLRFDYAVALTKDKGVLDPATNTYIGGDRIQAFRFSGGSKF